MEVKETIWGRTKREFLEAVATGDPARVDAYETRVRSEHARSASRSAAVSFQRAYDGYDIGMVRAVERGGENAWSILARKPRDLGVEAIAKKLVAGGVPVLPQDAAKAGKLARDVAPAAFLDAVEALDLPAAQDVMRFAKVHGIPGDSIARAERVTQFYGAGDGWEKRENAWDLLSQARAKADLEYKANAIGGISSILEKHQVPGKHFADRPARATVEDMLHAVRTLDAERLQKVVAATHDPQCPFTPRALLSERDRQTKGNAWNMIAPAFASDDEGLRAKAVEVAAILYTAGVPLYHDKEDPVMQALYDAAQSASARYAPPEKSSPRLSTAPPPPPSSPGAIPRIPRQSATPKVAGLALCLVLLSSAAQAEMKSFDLNPTTSPAPARMQSHDVSSPAPAAKAEQVAERTLSSTVNGYSVTPSNACFSQLGPGEALEIRRDFRNPWVECRRRLEERAQGTKKDAAAQDEAPETVAAQGLKDRKKGGEKAESTILGRFAADLGLDLGLDLDMDMAAAEAKLNQK